MDLEALGRRQLDRRRFLLGALAFTSAGLLAACGGGATTTAPSGAATSGASTAPTSAAAAAPTAAAAAPTTAAAEAPTSAAAAPTTAEAAPTTAAAEAPTSAAGAAPTSAAPAVPTPMPAESPVAAAGATAAPSMVAGGQTYTLDTPPAVANASAAKQFASQKLTYYGDSVGIGADIDQALTKRFTADTGIAVTTVPHPQSATDTYSVYQRFFQAQSADIDVMMLDVIWPGAFAQHLMDLTSSFSSDAGNFYPTIIENNTVNNKLVAIPWFGDFGMLYYRTDLLKKYGYSAPPQTWDELQEQAQKVVDGEKGANANFAGFVFQGNAYEGLTCDALEWIASSGGGTIVENGQVTLDNQAAKDMLNKAKGWIGTISPQGVTSYQEEEARNVFQGGNGMFMRNWPYAYALAGKSDSPVSGKFDVAPLPAASGQKHVGTVGGWQLGVSAYSKAPEASMEFVRYMTGPEVQTYRSVVGSFVPTRPAVAAMPEVVTAEPFLQNLQDVTRVVRPSRAAGERYNELSTAFYQGVNQILNGQDANTVVPNIVSQIQRISG